MNRRKFIAGAGGMGAATIGGIAMFGGSAAASSFKFTADDTGIELDDGDVENVYVDIDGELTWENFDEEITQMEITIESRIRTEDGEDVIDGWTVQRDGSAREPTELPDENTGKSNSYSGQVGSPKLSVLGEKGTEPFDEHDDGETSSVLVDLRLQVDLLNSDGNRADPQDEARVRETATFRATTTNKAATTEGSATAKPGME